MISPENGELLKDEDFRRIAREWTHDDREDGGEYPHVGAVHRDSGSEGRGEGHDHMHLLIARDKFSKGELEERKELSEELVRDLERFRGIVERAAQREAGREREPEKDREEGRETRRKQEEPDGREPER